MASASLDEAQRVVTKPEPRCPGLAGFGQSLGRVVADGVQQPVSACPSTSGSTTTRDLSTSPLSGRAPRRWKNRRRRTPPRPSPVTSPRTPTAAAAAPAPDVQQGMSSQRGRARCAGAVGRYGRPSPAGRSGRRGARRSAPGKARPRARASSNGQRDAIQGRQMAVTASALCSVRAKPGRAAAARSAKSRTASYWSRPAGCAAAASRRYRQRGNLPDQPARHPSGSWLVAITRSAGELARARAQGRRPRSGARSCRARAASGAARARRPGCRSRAAGFPQHANRRRHPRDDQPGSRRSVQLDQPHPSGKSAATVARPGGPAGFANAPAPQSVSARVSSRTWRRSPSSRSRPMNRFGSSGR